MKNVSYKHSQQGQAMIFGLLFLAAVLMVLLSLYNKGQLIKNRVQLENAADATVYSQAKLSARSQNFTAYTNRAMVANEVSIGQMVALLSWANHYKNVGAFVKYPAYNFPIAPPSPVTFSQVLEVVTLPYKIMGNAVSAPTKQIVDQWPTVVSAFNSGLGIFQQLFALSTLAAQFEMNINIVEGHQIGDQDNQMYTPPLGWYFMLQNYLLSYKGDNFDASYLAAALDIINTSNVTTGDLVGDFLGGQSGELESFINTNSPSTSNASDDAIDSYKRYAAIVNNNRDDFTKDRHWDIWETTPDIFPEITLYYGMIKLTIDLDFEVGFGIKNDGGAAYVTKGDLETNRDIEGLGWSAIDVTSFGVEFDTGLYVEFEFCLPLIGCEGGVLLDLEFDFPIGFPLAASTHQLVSNNRHAKTTYLDNSWGSVGTEDGMYGGDPDDSENDGPLDAFHAQALLWGQASPMLTGGVYGANRARDVTDSYVAPPGFYSLGDHFQETGVSYEFTVALAKYLDDIPTADHAGTFNIGAGRDQGDWDVAGDAIKYTRFETTTRSRAEGRGIDEGAYQRLVWNNDRPMMTISAAEVYFANPMQSNADGSDETASLFSPFWDARLREPSEISLLLATGEVDWKQVFGSIPSTSIGIVNYLLDSVADTVVNEGIGYVKDQLVWPFDDALEPPLDAAGDAVRGFIGEASTAISTTLEEF
jgi:hypothetical protein|tara:strand:- start:11962 stop:14064 length:2103 start_codon:yes stop_codon:yes gene_type:complete